MPTMVSPGSFHIAALRIAALRAARGLFHVEQSVLVGLGHRASSHPITPIMVFVRPQRVAAAFLLVSLPGSSTALPLLIVPTVSSGRLGVPR